MKSILHSLEEAKSCEAMALTLNIFHLYCVQSGVLLEDYFKKLQPTMIKVTPLRLISNLKTCLKVEKQVSI